MSANLKYGCFTNLEMQMLRCVTAGHSPVTDSFSVNQCVASVNLKHKVLAYGLPTHKVTY